MTEMAEANLCCENDPNFAIICSFIAKFGNLCGIREKIYFKELHKMLETRQIVPLKLKRLLMFLARKTRLTVCHEEYWERGLVRMCRLYSKEKAREIKHLGYANASLRVKVELLKELLEMQLDFNAGLKTKISKMSVEELRMPPYYAKSRQFSTDFEPGNQEIVRKLTLKHLHKCLDDASPCNCCSSDECSNS